MQGAGPAIVNCASLLSTPVAYTAVSSLLTARHREREREGGERERERGGERARERDRDRDRDRESEKLTHRLGGRAGHRELHKLVVNPGGIHRGLVAIDSQAQHVCFVLLEGLSQGPVLSVPELVLRRQRERQ
jgi:Ni/Co efflux regulator RcnB